MRRRAMRVWCLAAATALAGCTGAEGPSAQLPSGADDAGLGLGVPRAVHRATALPDGRVLLTGGCTEPGCGGFEAGRTTEIFDPVARRFRQGPRMSAARASGTATLLPRGRVLLSGGYPGEGRAPLDTAEVFDPATNRFVTVAPMTTPRANHTASLLPDGRVLLAGGSGAGGEPLASTELFDPASLTFTAGPPLPGPRALHAAVLVGADVLLIGGTVDHVAGLKATAVLRGGTWTAGPALRAPRVKHAAVRLADDRVLVVGGSDDVEGTRRLSSTELVDVVAGTSAFGPDLSEAQYKLDGAVVELPDRRIAIAGGRQLEVYDPRTNRISRVQEPPAPRRSFVSASVLSPLEVLVAGGYDDRIVPTAAARIVRVGPEAR